MIPKLPASWLRRPVQPNVGLSFLVSLVFLSIAYRATLWHDLSKATIVPPFFSKQVPALYLWKYLKNDLCLSIAAAGLIVAVSLVGRFCAKKAWHPLSAAVVGIEFLFANAVLFVAALIMLVHCHLLVEMNTGLTSAFLMEGTQQFGASNLWALMNPYDVAFLLTPVLVFHLFHFLVSRPGKGVLACALAGITLVVGLQFQPKRTDVGWEIMHNPVVFLALDLIKTGGNGSFKHASLSFANERNLPGPDQMQSVKLIDPAFVLPSAPKQPPACPQPPQGKWNVLLFVMESTGAQYVFDTAAGNEVPMPFLQRLSKEGLNLTNHYSTSNTSQRAGFSLLTGLYSRPASIDYSTQAQTRIPTCNKFVGADYHYFVVAASMMTHFFPRALLINNGFCDLNDKQLIPFHNHPELDPLAHNEIDTVDFLLQKIDRTPNPFFAIYWSNIPHWPYVDYGEEYRIGHFGDPKRNGYYNNLRALDTQIKRIYDHFAKTGRLENTILVFLGDHGEGFGQHPGILVHARGTFNETSQVPAIFHHPALFPPRQIDWATSHVDILPTLLDAMSIRYPEQLLQGESILRGQPNRKYVFTVSAAADYVSAIDRSSLKVSLSFVSPDGYAYDLSNDPLENTRLPLDSFSIQADAVGKFRNYQRQIVKQYSEQILEKERAGESCKKSWNFFSKFGL